MVYVAGLDVVGAWADSAATSEGILRNTAGDILLVQCDYVRKMLCSISEGFSRVYFLFSDVPATRIVFYMN